MSDQGRLPLAGTPPPGMPAPAGGPPAAGAEGPPSDALGGGPTQASPEEQKQADHFTLRALQMVYRDGMFERVVDMLGGGGDPIKGLAMATEMLVARVANAAEKAGEVLSPDAVYHAGGNILEDLAEISRQAGVHDYTQDKNGLESAWFQALDMFRERLDGVGEIDRDDATAGLQRLQQADSDGTLERLMMDLSAADEAGPAGGPPGSPPGPAAGPPGRPPGNGQRGPRGLGTAMGV